MRARLALLLPVTILVAHVAERSAYADRFALIVGANSGDAQEVTLRYAASDAQKIAHTLRTYGDFEAQDIVTLSDRATADEMRRTLIALNARIRQNVQGSLLFVYFSGHGDSESLHLTGTRLPIRELRDLLTGSPAAVRVLAVDACRSGTLTRVKGGKPAPAFEIITDPTTRAEGLAILTSSASTEDSQESDQLGSSFFTHYFVSALMGAADRNADGDISISEAFEYAAEETLAATTLTVVGPQHPTYRVDLRGREELILTHPARLDRSTALLRFAPRGRYLLQRIGSGGGMVAELAANAPRRQLAVEPGTYLVTRRERDYLEQTDVTVSPGQTVDLTTLPARRISYARVVRKGGTERKFSASLFATAGVRGELLDLGTAWRTDVGTRLDLSALSLELRVGITGSSEQNRRLRIATHELAVALAGLRTFDLGRVSLALGLEVGALWIAQRFDHPLTRPRDTAGATLAAVGQMEVPFANRFYFRLDAALMTYFLRVLDRAPESHLETPVTYRFTGGFGVYFR